MRQTEEMQDIPGLSNFYEHFGQAVLAALPAALRAFAAARLDAPQDEDPILLIVLAHAGRARRALAAAGSAAAARGEIDAAVMRAAASVIEAAGRRQSPRPGAAAVHV